MITLLTIVHVLVCIFLIGIVLLQHGKGADMGATFGGSSQTVFGTDGPLPLLNKITTGSAILFMVTSVALAYYSAHQTKGSVMKTVRPGVPIEQQIDTPTAGLEEAPLTRSSNEALSMPTSSEFPGEEQTQAPAAFPGDPNEKTDSPQQ
jgi:preprotein translocase subunit SecG